MILRSMPKENRMRLVLFFVLAKKADLVNVIVTRKGRF